MTVWGTCLTDLSLFKDPVDIYGTLKPFAIVDAVRRCPRLRRCLHFEIDWHDLGADFSV
jgi:hypothetical protein